MGPGESVLIPLYAGGAGVVVRAQASTATERHRWVWCMHVARPSVGRPPALAGCEGRRVQGSNLDRHSEGTLGSTRESLTLLFTGCSDRFCSVTCSPPGFILVFGLCLSDLASTSAMLEVSSWGHPTLFSRSGTWYTEGF